MAIQETTTYTVGTGEFAATFADKDLAVKYDSLISDQTKIQKVLQDLENSLLPYLKGMGAGNRVIIRDWRVITAWEFHRQGFALPADGSTMAWLVPESVKEHALKVSKASDLAKGDSTRVEPTNVPPEARKVA